AYPGVTVPTTDAERKACVGEVADFGNTSLTGSSAFASLDGLAAVTIPANSSVMVYFASYFGPTSSNTTGAIKVNVKVESFDP
ncbi:MAG TPA: hypothetical protein VM580_17865, partial [Labilithrix sp.]|nr:hypothetical protein [Labilithrix sp.]